MSKQAQPREELYHWIAQNCPVCEIPPDTRLGRRGGNAHRQQLGVNCEIWQCGSCGLVFPNPMPVPVGGLDQHYGLGADEYFQHHDSQEKELAGAGMMHQAEKLVGTKGRLLDIGAGRGELLRSAICAGWEAVGIEPSITFAEHAAKYSGAEIRNEPLERCEFGASSFDVVVLSGVLEHLYNPDETIREVARVLRKGGALFLDVPNEAGLYFRIGNLYQKFKGRDWVVNLAPTFEPFHVFGFGPKSLRALLAKHGFTPATWRVYGGESRLPSNTGLTGIAEQQAAKLVTTVSNFGKLGTYIETWAIKQ